MNRGAAHSPLVATGDALAVPASERLATPPWLLPVTAAFFAVGLILRVAVAVHFPNMAHPDEIFQTLEPAHRLAFGNGVITWEWREGVRSWVVPAVLAVVMRATAWMGPGSSGYLYAIDILLSALSLVTVWFGFAWARRAAGINAGLIAAGACAIWFDLVYFAPKALYEVLSTNFLLPGLYLGVYGERFEEKKRLFWAGLFCGVALALRIQLAPAIAFAGAYFCWGHWRKRILPVCLGMSLPIVVFGLVDWITWHHPFQSFYLYFWVNAVQGKSHEYGVMPWYWYLPALAYHFGPVLLLALAGLRRSPLLGWIALIVLVSHSAISHKELRFLFPIFPIILTLAAIGIVQLIEPLSKRFATLRSSFAVVVPSLSCLALLSLYLGSQLVQPSQASGALIAFNRLSKDKSVCGVAIRGMEWFEPGGYTHLNRKVPIVLLPPLSDVGIEVPSFNAVVTGTPWVDSGGTFKLKGCWYGACLYERPGPCAPPEDNEINAVLKRYGM